MALFPRLMPNYLDGVFDDFFTPARGDDMSKMRCDIYEKDGDYHIEMDIPGFDKNEITIDCENGYLTITANKEKVEKDETKKYIRRERNYGKYERTFYLGDVDASSIRAKFKHGMLKIIVPKKVEKESKQHIQIED